MARYYFHFEDGIDLEDTEGVELPSMKSALNYARIFADEIRQKMPNGAHRWDVVITDATGEFVALVPVRFE